VFFAPAYTAPLGLGVPLAVTIHDVSFLAHPEWFRPRERWRRRVLTRRTASSAAVVLTDSEFSRSEIAAHLHVESGRLTTIPPGIAPALQTAKGTKREPLVLYVGSLFNRRRLPDLIAAFGRMAAARPEARLVIVGADRTWPAQHLHALAAQVGADRIQILDYVTEDELRVLYGRAAVFAFLSEYEGFGLTPLEALSAGVPIVVLDTPVAREVYGPAAEYVRRGDIAGTAAALDAFLRSPEAGRAQLSRAAAVLERYDWTRAADATLERIEAIAR
jgi:glycosyltransferase involved in cell wall biosynthesis